MSKFIALIWERLTRELAESSPLDFFIKLCAAIILLAAIYFARSVLLWIWRWLISWIRSWWLSRRTLLAAISALQRRLHRGLDAVARVDHGTHESEGTGIWLTKPIQRPWLDAGYHMKLMQSIPIWVFANLKGGVGKTTNASNLAGYYALQLLEAGGTNKPVLLLDLDYQGSASSMCLPDSLRVPPPEHDSHSTRLISGDMPLAELRNAPAVQHLEIANLPLRIVPAYYDLAQAENRLLIEWLFEQEAVDARYVLARILHDPLIQNHFSRIIIDAPPRLTTACVQALCASTALIIPTVVDRLSGEAVGTFVGQIETLKSEGICPYITYGGVIGYKPGAATKHVGDAEDSIRDALRNYGLDEDLYIREVVLRHSPLLAESAGTTLAVCKSSPRGQVVELREKFAQLAAEIEKRIAKCKSH